MATNRSRRLRKKLCVDEFQELGFELNLNFKEDLSDEAVDAFLDAFLSDAMTANGLGYVGGDDYGLVCLAERGSVSEEQRAALYQFSDDDARQPTKIAAPGQPYWQCDMAADSRL